MQGSQRVIYQKSFRDKYAMLGFSGLHRYLVQLSRRYGGDSLRGCCPKNPKRHLPEMVGELAMKRALIILLIMLSATPLLAEEAVSLTRQTTELLALQGEQFHKKRMDLVKGWMEKADELFEMTESLTPIPKAVWRGIYARVKWPEQVARIESEVDRYTDKWGNPRAVSVSHTGVPYPRFEPSRRMRLSIEGIIDSSSLSALPLSDELKKADEHYNSMILTDCDAMEHYLAELFVTGVRKSFSLKVIQDRIDKYGDPALYSSVQLLELLEKRQRKPLDLNFVDAVILQDGFLDHPLYLDYAIQYAYSRKRKVLYRKIAEHKRTVDDGVYEKYATVSICELFAKPIDNTHKETTEQLTYTRFYWILKQPEVTRDIGPDGTDPTQDLKNLAQVAQDLLGKNGTSFFEAREVLIGKWKQFDYLLDDAISSLPPVEYCVWSGILNRIRHPENVKKIEEKIETYLGVWTDPPIISRWPDGRPFPQFDPTRRFVLESEDIWFTLSCSYPGLDIRDVDAFFRSIALPSSSAVKPYLEELLVTGWRKPLANQRTREMFAKYGDPTVFSAATNLAMLERYGARKPIPQLFEAVLHKPGVLNTPLMLEFAIRYAYYRKATDLYEPIIEHAVLIEKGISDESDGEIRIIMFGVPEVGLGRRQLASRTYTIFRELVGESEKLKAGPQRDYVISPRELPDPATEPVVEDERINDMAPRARELMNLPYDKYCAAREMYVKEWSNTPNALLKAMADLPPLERAIWGGIFARVMYPEQVKLLETQFTSAKIELADPPLFAVAGDHKMELFSPVKPPMLSNSFVWTPYKNPVAERPTQFFDYRRDYYSHILVTVCKATEYFLAESFVIGRGADIADKAYLAKKALYGDPTAYYAIMLLQKLDADNKIPPDGELIVQNLLRPGILDIPLNLNFALHYAVSHKEKRLFSPIIDRKQLILKGIEDTIDGRTVVALFGDGPRPSDVSYMFYKPLEELAWIEKQWNELNK